MATSQTLTVNAKPYPYVFSSMRTALLVIDMQKDFLLPNGFGEIQGGSLEAVQASIAPVKRLLDACRQAGLAIFHTREGHVPDLSDCPSSKLIRQNAAPTNAQHLKVIGDIGEMGRLLVRRESGHDIVDELQPLPGEVVIDKPGKGAFWNTTLMDKLKARGITHLIICGIEEATAGYNDSFKCPTLDMISWSEGLFGFIASLQPLLETLAPLSSKAVSNGSTTPPQTPPAFDDNLSIASLQGFYRKGLSPLTMLESLFERIEKYKMIDPAVWIHLQSKASMMKRAGEIQAIWPDRTKLPPLFGVPFSVKDSIDIVGLPTTTACPPLAHVPPKSSPVYELLLEQGAIFIAAGSGRVPSGFNGVVGYKPTRGLLSCVGVTPACLSLDCIALIATTVEDARTVWNICAEYDPNDRYAKTSAPIQRHVNSTGPQASSFKFGIPPPEALAICTTEYRRLFNDSVQRLQNMGGSLMPIDWSPFERAGKLLYDGSFVCERLASLPDDWLDKNRDHLHPVIKEIFEGVVARNSTAVEAYRDLQAKALYTRLAEKVFAYSSSGVDVVVVPTAPTHFTVEEVLADPIAKNSVLGEFTHFGNVLDLCAVAVPAGIYEAGSGDQELRLPFSVTFLGGSRSDAETLEIARRFEASDFTTSSKEIQYVCR
ncbi:MAG: hypothetical protein Q9222_001318 [Ikaeria aurantiellina]